MIGHNGDAPGLIATFQRERADIRAIGLIGSSPSGYHCYQVLVRKDAPDFTSSKEALKWLDGKKVATPKGSCSDRFFQYVLEKEGIKPTEYLNLSIGVITTNLRTGQIDGACTWDPQGAAVSTIAGKAPRASCQPASPGASATPAPSSAGRTSSIAIPMS
jgi:NitT/TauT family transport system substrate-binding protein